MPFRSRNHITCIGALVLAGLIVAGCNTKATADRQAEVAQRGSAVMPFDLDATTHTFTTTPDGGVQRVTADDPADARQIELIRQHLQLEASNFSKGDFDDPARIHGMDMPGVKELAEGYTRITVVYSDTATGGELRYTTEDAPMRQALHEWFDRQLIDHGAHAEPG